VGAAPAYVPAVDEPELYVNLLVTDRELAGRGIGRRLLIHARQIARTRGVGLLQVDCYSGADTTLVRYHEQEGFSAAGAFTVELPAGPWPGQVLARRLDQRCVISAASLALRPGPASRQHAAMPPAGVRCPGTHQPSPFVAARGPPTAAADGVR